ncbi:carbonic anhydrase [Domibacillus robiginosus]|uniref:carbonic anhydrase n=1 Tax=Domibacillus robiginosus TaxID=1071054 RepID=UPI00067E591E|nr:carbonic anhydrase family protein [Domibacillus robiginosus]
MLRKKIAIPVSFTYFTLALASCTFIPSQSANGDESSLAEKGHEWSYEGETGPGHWVELDPLNAACVNGTEQSPINIQKAQAKKAAKVEELKINYIPSAFSLVNNGHTVQGNIQTEGNSIKLNGKDYTLAQFHFHTPSEHLINGHSYDMELHLVHKSKEGQLAVLGILIKEGKTNTVLEQAWNVIPKEKTTEGISVPELIDLKHILPKNKHNYQYAGSLTTPPCSEGVQWVVYKQPIEMSTEQINIFREIFPDNHRPVQAIGDREVIKH